MTTDEIRRTFQEFFEANGHRRLPSASLVPPPTDTSTLLTIAGMQPLKPYFLGVEEPPHNRLVTCQKVFRTPDIDNVGTTHRHLTFFEMLGNFSVGDYFKQGAAEFAWKLSTEGFGIDPEKIWITVFEGDEELGLGPDQEAIDAWLEIGVPRERIVLCDRDENFWQSGPTGPCGPCSELYVDRGLEFGSEDDLPGGDNERFLEFWNLVFMQYNQDPVGTLTPLPAQNIDTGLGLNRLAAYLQGTTSVFETDEFKPLIELGEELSGKRYGETFATDRALRILADHTRGMSFLIADGVVPSNEDRGYVLRRVMRRAIVQGRRLGIEPGFLPRFAGRRARADGRRLPGAARAGRHDRHVAAQRGGDVQPHARPGHAAARRHHRPRARGGGGGHRLRPGVPAARHLRLPVRAHARAGRRAGARRRRAGLRAPHGAAARAGARRRPRRARRRPRPDPRLRRAGRVPDHLHRLRDDRAGDRRSSALSTDDGRTLAKLVESPFYATGGGQIADAGVIECEDGDCSARVVDVIRVGDDQALVLEPLTGELAEGERVIARVDPSRHLTERNHTATHLLHAALRDTLGSHVRQAGSYVGPDKLRFDFTHGAPLTEDELREVEDAVNRAIVADSPVRALTTTLDEARALGAMALFGEKYGDVVRMVEVGDGNWSRELCGGTHVRSTGVIGAFKITTETSSAANVRRIEAVTSQAAIEDLRRSDRLLTETARVLRTSPESVPDVAADRERKRRELEKRGAAAAPVDDRVDADKVVELDGVKVLLDIKQVDNPKALPDLADRLKNQLGDPAVVVLGARVDGRANLLVAATPGAVERGVRAGAVVKAAALVVGGGGGGRDTMAQAGGREPEKLPDALKAAREEIERALDG